MTLQEQFVKDITALEKSGAGLPFVLVPSEAFMLLAALQLVLRHPKVDGVTADFLRNLAQNIEQRLCRTPALKEVAAQGWNQEYDIHDDRTTSDSGQSRDERDAPATEPHG